MARTLVGTPDPEPEPPQIPVFNYGTTTNLSSSGASWSSTITWSFPPPPLTNR